MARPLRIEFPGTLYHVTSRGDRREPIYEDDADREQFLATLAEVVERYNWLCHAYCLMTNHYHLILLRQFAGDRDRAQAPTATQPSPRISASISQPSDGLSEPRCNNARTDPAPLCAAFSAAKAPTSCGIS